MCYACVVIVLTCADVGRFLLNFKHQLPLNLRHKLKEKLRFGVLICLCRWSVFCQQQMCVVQEIPSEV